MAKRNAGASTEWEDFTHDLGLISPEELLEAIKRAKQFVFDLETTGLSPKRDRIEGIAFYVPPLNGGRAVRAWFPFRSYTFMCNVKAGSVLELEGRLGPHGVDFDEIREQIKDKEPDELILVDLRPAMDQEEIMNQLRPIFLLEDVIGTAAHRKFDDSFLFFASGTDDPIVVRNIKGDSMLADFCSDERRKRYGLKIRVRQEFGVQMTTYDEATRGRSLLPFCNAKPLGIYAMDDCYYCYRLHERSLAKLREQTPPPKNRTEPKWTVEKQLGRVMGKLERVYWGIDTKISDVIMEMETSGCLIDWKWLTKVEERLKTEKLEIATRMEKFLGWPINPNSVTECADALFAPPPDGLGLPLAGIPIGVSGIPSTADKVIKHFARFHPLVQDILKWRSHDTVLSSFVTKLIKLATESDDGRVYSGFHQTRTVIARLASSKPINFQNQPREKNLVRRAYVSYRDEIDDPTILLYGGDYSQIELRILAHLAKEKNMIEVYGNGSICLADNGGSCARYKVWSCEDCGHTWTPENWSGAANSCPSCASQHTEHQRRCRHVDLHQRTAEDAGVKRNPLAKNCVTADVPVLTEHGFLRMDEIATGPGRQPNSMRIVGDDGELRPLDSTYAPGVQDVLAVEMDYGLKLKATPDHEFMIMENGQIVKRRAEELKPGDAAIIMVGRDVHGSNTIVPEVTVDGATSYKDIDLPVELTSDLARFLGYVASEGRYYQQNKSYQFALGLGNASTEMIKDFGDIARRLVGDRLKVYPYEDKTVFTVSSKKLNTWLEALNVGGSSANKTVPRVIRSAPWKLKREFLRAYFESDGTNKQPSGTTGKGSYHVSATSKSERLIRELHAELANVGILGYIRSEWAMTKKKGRQQYWTWSIRRQADLRRFRDKVGFISTEKCAALDKALENKRCDMSNRFLENVEPLLESMHDKLKGEKRTKLRQVIRRDPNNPKAPPVRFGDDTVELLKEDLPDQLRNYVERGIWTARIRSISPAGREPVFDLYEPVNTAMVVGCNIIFDCNFGLAYRMGAPKFCVYADLFDADGMPMVGYAKEIIQRWHDAYPDIEGFHLNTEWDLEANGWIAETLFGRRRRLDEEARINRYRAVTQGIQFKVSGCVTPDTKILTETGYKRVDKLNPISDRIFDGHSFTGSYTVSRVGTKQLVNVMLEDGRRISCSPDHRFAVMSGLKLEWKKIKELSPGDFIATADVFSPLGKSPGGDANAGYLLGLLIGDGFYNDARGFSISASVHEPDWIATCEESIIRVFGDKIRENLHRYRHKTSRGGECCAVTVHNADARRSLLVLGLETVSKEDKYIPPWIFTASPDIRAAVVAGLFDSDGGARHYEINGYSQYDVDFSSRVEHLAVGVHLLLSSLGIESSCRAYDATVEREKDGVIVGEEPTKQYKVRVTYRGFKKFQELVKLRHDRKRLCLEKVATEIGDRVVRRELPESFVKAVAEYVSGLPAFADRRELYGYRMRSAVAMTEEEGEARRRAQTRLASARDGSAGEGMLREILDYAGVGDQFDDVFALGWKKIEMIDETNDRTQMFDISIDGPNHAYVANGLLTHNSAQDVIKTGMIRVYQWRNNKIANSRPAERKLWEKFRFLLQIHDEVIWEGSAELKHEVLASVKEIMESVGKGNLAVPLEFSLKSGINWDQIH